MFLEFITLLVVVLVVVSPYAVGLYIYSRLKKKIDNDREDQNYKYDLDRANQNYVIRQTERIARQTTEMSQRILDCQSALNEKMDAFSQFVDERATVIGWEHEQFRALAKADMLSARREELLRTKELKVALERLMGVAMTSRQPPAPNDVLALERLTSRIEELETILKDSKQGELKVM